MMLSLPETWNYTTRGLAAICKEGVDAIRSAIRELEAAGYIVRRLLRGDNGQIADTEYIIYEQPQDGTDTPPSPDGPQAGGPDTPLPYTENPSTVEPPAGAPCPKKPAQLNTNSSIKNQFNTYPIHPSVDGPADAGMGAGLSERDIWARRDQIRAQIDYDYLVQCEDPKQVDELVELMLEVALTTDPAIGIGRGKKYPTALVRERFRLITSDHITGILESLWENHAQVRNPKAYLLAALFNAPTSTNNQITMQVSHDYPRGG